MCTLLEIAYSSSPGSRSSAGARKASPGMKSTTNSGDGLIDRLPFSDLAVLDDEGRLHRGKASSRNQSYSGTSYTIQENLNVPFPEARTAVAVKLRVLKDVLEKRVQFEFGDIRVE